jgi:hypothetical protein
MRVFKIYVKSFLTGLAALFAACYLQAYSSSQDRGSVV